jgi:hypothetical protein
MTNFGEGLFSNKMSKEEKLDWFSKSEQWSKLHSGILKYIIDKFGDLEFFGNFITVSEDLTLIKRYSYLNIYWEVEGMNPKDPWNGRGEGDLSESVLAHISEKLCEAAIELRDVLGRVKRPDQSFYEIHLKINFDRAHQIQEEACKIALFLNEINIPACLHLAEFYLTENNDDLVEKYADQGLNLIQKIRSGKEETSYNLEHLETCLKYCIDPFHKSRGFCQYPSKRDKSNDDPNCPIEIRNEFTFYPKGI